MTGNSHSHKGAVEMIERVFAKIPSSKKRYFRADSTTMILRISLKKKE